MLRLSLVFHFFSLSLFITTPCCCLQPLSISPLLSSYLSTFQNLCLMLFFSNAHSLFLSLPFSHSFFLILRGSSPVIHPGQATIPYKASGSPRLASYFHIRPAVTDRVYTGSSLECKGATQSAVPQTLLCSLLLGTNLVTPPPLLSPFAILAALFPPHFSPFLLNSSSHLTPLYFPFPSYFFSSFSQLHLSHLSVSSIPSHLNTKHTQTHSHLSFGSMILAEHTVSFGTETQHAQMVAHAQFTAYTAMQPNKRLSRI